MPKPTKATKARIKAVAKLRVEGATWAQIAKKYGYASDESACKCMSWDHADLWRAEYEQARALYLDDVESEAILTQRQLLRSLDESIKQRAAHSLLAHCAKLRAQQIEVRGGLHHTGSFTDLMTDVFASNGTGNGHTARSAGAANRLAERPD